MIDLKAAVQNAERIDKQLRTDRKKAARGADTAVRVEGYRLMRKLRVEIRAGAPGGRAFAPLTWIARRASGRLRPNKPLASMARAIGYETTRTSPISLRLGFVGKASSDTWRKLARMHQTGFLMSEREGPDTPGTQSTGLDARMRRYLAGVGGKLGKGAVGRKMLFLKKDTRTFRAPARPIIDPFWSANHLQAMANIRENFRRKLRGERI